MRPEELLFEKYLHARGLKFTPQRRLILGKVLSTKDHFEANALLSAFDREGTKLSRATVYRTLPLLVKSGLIREVQFGEQQTHYEHTLGQQHHDHMICMRCGKVVEFYDGSIEKLQERVCTKYRFHAKSHALEIKGYCAECRERVSPSTLKG
jgi:Fur family ferric uptake transcriptional regulator